MKKNIIILFSIGILFASCTQKSVTQHGEVTKVADYLYEVTYSQLDESVYDHSEVVQQKAACSSVRNGAFHGRNLDLFYNEGCEVVVHTTASADRFASVAVCGATPSITDKALENGDSKIMQFLPFFSLDGINENGVAANVNVVPSIDFPIATGTNPGAPRLHMGMSVRYILDHAQSAKHAIELLQSLDLFGGFGDNFGLHLMISDTEETYIVEIINNQLVYNQGERENSNNVMTNLYSTQLPNLTPHAEGVERYAILKENYAEGNTEEGMAALMQRVRYTLAYERTTDPFWYSESCGIFQEEDGSTTEITIDTDHDFIMQYMEPSFQTYARHERDGSFWQTVNTSVYNLDNRTLLLYVQEDYEHPYRFEIAEKEK